MKATPELSTGWYQEIPEDVYHSWNLASNSRLTLIERSPLHLKWELDHPDEDETEALMIGAAVHCRVLTPHLFDRRYVQCPELDRRTKAGKEAFAALLEEHPGKTILRASQWTDVLGMSDALIKHEHVSMLLEAATEREVSGIWEDAETGLRCKMRADMFCDEFGAIVDIKTTRDASKRAFEKSILDLRYYRQGAMYLNGAKALGKNVSSFAIVAVEKTAPYAVACYQIDQEYIEAGARELAPLMDLYAECERNDSWLGYDENLVNILPPEWLVKKIVKNMRGPNE